jgi:hypothetical protein
LVLRPCRAQLLAPGRPLPTRACAATRLRPHWLSPSGKPTAARTRRLRIRVCPDWLDIESLPPEHASCWSPCLACSRITGCVVLVPNCAPAPPDRTGQGLPTAPGCALHLEVTPPYLLSTTALPSSVLHVAGYRRWPHPHPPCPYAAGPGAIPVVGAAHRTHHSARGAPEDHRIAVAPSWISTLW